MKNYRNFMQAKSSPGRLQNGNLLTIIQFSLRAFNGRKLITLLLIIFCPLIGFSKQIFDTAIRPADAAPHTYLPLLTSKRVALIINQTSRVGNESLLDIMLSRHINVKKIFVP